MPFPSSISQAVLQSGFREIPFPNVISSPTDYGLPKTRRRFTGKSKLIECQIELESDTEYDDLMTFYYGEAAEGTAYFTFNDQHGGTMQLRFVSLEITALGGGLQWLADMVLEEQPHA